MVFHASALSRSQCAKKSTKDVFNEDISEDLLELFVIGTHESLDVGCLDSVTTFSWITQNILQRSSLCVWISVALAFNFLHSPGKQSEGSQTS